MNTYEHANEQVLEQTAEQTHEATHEQDQKQAEAEEIAQTAKQQAQERALQKARKLLEASGYTERPHVSETLIEMIERWLVPSLKLDLDKEETAMKEYRRLLRQLREECRVQLRDHRVQMDGEVQKEVQDIVEMASMAIDDAAGNNSRERRDKSEAKNKPLCT